MYSVCVLYICAVLELISCIAVFCKLHFYVSVGMSNFLVSSVPLTMCSYLQRLYVPFLCLSHFPFPCIPEAVVLYIQCLSVPVPHVLRICVPIFPVFCSSLSCFPVFCSLCPVSLVPWSVPQCSVSLYSMLQLFLCALCLSVLLPCVSLPQCSFPYVLFLCLCG